MQPPVPDPPQRAVRSADDLPYGPLPARSGQPAATPADPVPLEQLVDLSWLEPDEPPEPPEAARDRDSTTYEQVSEASSGEVAESSVGLSVTGAKPEGDDDVHFGVAARALGVSRRTVERMVKRGELDRGPSNTPATVSKRALVAALERRRRDVGHLTRAAEVEKANSTSEWLSVDLPRDPSSALRELLVPVLAPLLDEFVAVRTRADVLETQLESLTARAEQERRRDELLVALVTRGWWGRRKTRKAVLRHYVLGDDHPRSSSHGE